MSLLSLTPAHAQDLQVCAGKGFTLASGADAVGTSAVTYTWYENGVAMGSSNTASLGVPAGRAAGTYAYVRMASNDDCVLPSNTYTVEALSPPAAPTGASSNARCGAGTVTFSAAVPAGVTIDWYTADTGGALVSGGGSVTSFSPSINASATYYAEARNTTTGCVSETRLAVGATVGNPSVAGQAADPMCGCESALSNCSGTCKACCGWSEYGCSFTERYPAQYVAIVNRAAAPSVCSALGEGWRLPTAAELQCMGANRPCLDGLYHVHPYWSSSYAPNNRPYACQLDGGACTEGNPNIELSVTCVR